MNKCESPRHIVGGAQRDIESLDLAEGREGLAQNSLTLKYLKISH